jgi:hypothetical protein
MIVLNRCKKFACATFDGLIDESIPARQETNVKSGITFSQSIDAQLLMPSRPTFL